MSEVNLFRIKGGTVQDLEDEIMEKRDSLIDALEERMQQRTESEPLSTIRWQVV